MPGCHFPFIPLNKREDGQVVEKSSRIPTVSTTTNRGPCDLLRRYHDGRLDVHAATQTIVELVKRVKDANLGGKAFIPLNASEKALLTLIIPGTALGVPQAVAATMLRLSKREKLLIAHNVATHFKTLQNWNAGYGGGAVEGSGMVISKGCKEDKSFNAEEEKREDPKLLYKDDKELTRSLYNLASNLDKATSNTGGVIGGQLGNVRPSKPSRGGRQAGRRVSDVARRELKQSTDKALDDPRDNTAQSLGKDAGAAAGRTVQANKAHLYNLQRMLVKGDQRSDPKTLDAAFPDDDDTGDE